MLDEIDKFGGFPWRPASALLEVFDPEQNHMFLDHYLDVEFDLSSHVHRPPTCWTPFLRRSSTAWKCSSSRATPSRRRSRSPSATWCQAVEGTGLTSANIVFTDDALLTIIRSYTREAGVRNLEREIASICRKVAREVVARATRTATRSRRTR